MKPAKDLTPASIKNRHHALGGGIPADRPGQCGKSGDAYYPVPGRKRESGGGRDADPDPGEGARPLANNDSINLLPAAEGSCGFPRRLEQRLAVNRSAVRGQAGLELEPVPVGCGDDRVVRRGVETNHFHRGHR